MGTKLKTIASQNLTQFVMKMIFSILSIVVLIAIGFIIKYESIAYTDKFYNMTEFKTQFERRVHNIVEKELFLKSYENINEQFRENNAIDYNFMITRLDQIEINLKETPSFRYYIKDLENGEIYTNFSEYKTYESLMEYPFYVMIKDDKIVAKQKIKGVESDLEWYTSRDTLKNLKEFGEFEGIFVVQEPFGGNDLFGEILVEYNAVYPYATSFDNYYAGVLACLIALFFILVYLIVQVLNPYETPRTWSDRIPNDLKIVIGTAGVVLFFKYNVGYLDDIVKYFFTTGLLQWLGIVIIVINVLWVLLELELGLSVIKGFFNSTLIKNTMVYKVLAFIFSKLKSVYRALVKTKVFKKHVLGWTLLYAFLNFALGTWWVNSDGNILLLWIPINIFCLYVLYKNLFSLQTIMNHVNQRFIEKALDLEQLTPLYHEFAHDINSISNSLNEAIETALKGERLKTELITNVSHDLKTPLTGMINYVALLKQQTQMDEDSRAYIKVIDEKTQRLKVLIDDLLEVSKATTGNVDLKPEKLDLCQLLVQVLAEFDESIQSQRFEIIHSDFEKPIWVDADSTKMWRIIQNLISNITKYALVGTRVYITLREDESKVVLEMKNISKDAISMHHEELTERFVRGDASRHTDGSGLGLAIARELVKLHDGEMKVVVDGDLFKIIIILKTVKTSENALNNEDLIIVEAQDKNEEKARISEQVDRLI